MSQWQNIYRHLKTKGFDVYSPGQHTGDCTAPYVVIRDAGVSRPFEFSSVQVVYDILCYVPQDQFSTLEPYVNSVEEAMKGLYPAVISMHFRTPSFLDDTIKGHMVSTQYRNNRKL